jgi:type II secretory pathway pseudopilin PulG
VIHPTRIRRWLAVALLAGVATTACRKEEQAVTAVAKTAEQAQQHAQAAATESDAQRAALAKIPLPTKSLYINVHDPSEWQNPFISADAESLDLRVTMADANPSPIGQDSMLRPVAARRQELHIRPADLAKALIALPPGAWQYGRVVAVAESPEADRKKRPAVRRNVEAAIQKLNDLGVVVEEWPSR